MAGTLVRRIANSRLFWALIGICAIHTYQLGLNPRDWIRRDALLFSGTSYQARVLDKLVGYVEADSVFGLTSQRELKRLCELTRVGDEAYRKFLEQGHTEFTATQLFRGVKAYERETGQQFKVTPYFGETRPFFESF